jgi:rare lipoprotein A
MRALKIWILVGIAAALSHPAQARHVHPRRHITTSPGVVTAGFDGWREHGRRMADGHRFRALGTSAASRTLPLGSHVRVTNLATGRSAVVVIQDRGPYVRGRSLDVSLGTARVLGMEKKGLARVRVKPLTNP